MMQRPVFQKNQVMVHGRLQATDGPGNVLLHQGNSRAQSFLHGIRKDNCPRSEDPNAEGRRAKEERSNIHVDKDKRRGKRFSKRKAKSHSDR